jgi:ATP-dependent helicase/nuclease subunit A
VTDGRVRRDAAPAGTERPLAPAPRAHTPLPPPASAPPAIRSLSYSALQQWRRCGYRFYLQRILRLPEEPVPPRGGDGGLEARLRGSLVHAALETGEPVATIAEHWGVNTTSEELDEMTALVTNFAASPLAGRIAAATRVHREHTFTFPLAGALLTGVVDVLAEEADGTALIVDYKSDRLAPDEDVAAYVARDYGVQRAAYALAALKQGHQTVEIAYALLERPHEPVSRRFTQDDVPGLTAELEQMAAGALEGRFEVADEPHLDLCAGCPGRRALCVHPEELTGRELPARDEATS